MTSDSLVDLYIVGEKQKLRQQLLSSSSVNPDTYAEASKIARKHNTAPEFIEAQIDQWRKEEDFNPENIGTLIDNHYEFSQWLSKEENAKLSHDDINALTYAFDKTRSFAGAGVQFGSDIIGGTGDTIKSTAELGFQTDQRRRDYERRVNPDPNTFQQGLSVATTGLSNINNYILYGAGSVLDFASEQGLDKLAEGIRPPEERRDFVDAVSEGLGQVAAQIVLFVRNPAAGTGALFATGAEQQSDRLDAAGVNDPARRLTAQLAGGGVTAVTERVQLGILLNRVPGLQKIAGKIPQELQNKWLGRFVDIGTAGGAEATQEVIEGFLQDLIAYGVYNPDQEFFTTIREEATTAGTVGAIARAFILSATGGRRASTYQEQADYAERLRQAAREAKEAGQGTKLIARDPEKFKEFLSNANTDGQEITLDGTVVEEMYQSEQDMEKFFEAVPEARAQFAESRDTGSDIRLPADKLVYAMAVNQEGSLDFIADFVKPEGGLTSAQATDADFVNEQIEDILRQAREEQAAFENEQQQQEFYERVERQVRDNLMDANRLGEKARTPDAAAQEAALYASFAKTLIERGGASAQAVLENVFGGNFEVRGPTPPPPALPITGEDAYIDTLRKQEIAKARKAEKKGGVADLLGKVRKPREKATPKPLINALINRGKIRRGSPIQAELEAVGVDPKSYPRLFAKDGALSDIDNIPVDELQDELGVSGVFRVDEDLNGYVDRQELLDLLRDETFGNYIQTDAEVAQQQQDEYDAQVLEELTNRGVDITEADNDTVKRTLAQAAEEYASGTYFQEEGRTGKRGSIQFGEQGQRVINLFEGADESTFFHETGHLFLDVFGQIAADPDAPQQIKDDFDATLKWLGVESADQIGVDQHEKWARGFEAYLYEGKGPSETLRSSFDRFKIWLINVYKNIKALNVKLDDNIRGVFDRLLATDNEIEALKDNTLFRPNEQTLEMLNETERAKYLKQQERAISEAKNKLFRKALRQKRRENAQWYKEERAKVQADEEQLLQESGLYRAIEVVTTGKDFNGDTVFEGEYRLSEQDVVDLYGNKEILKYLPRGSRVRGPGVDLKILAEMYGFKNPKDMIDTMINADPYKLRLQKNTDEEMIRRYGDMLNDGTIEREALEAVMTENPELNFTELEALSRRTGQEYPSDGDFKTAARRAINEQKVDHSIKPDKYYRAALRAEREYGKALAKEDYETAADAKRRVILNKYMFKEARDAREEVNKALKRFQKLSKQPPKKQKPKIDPEYHEKIWEALGAFNLGPRLTEAKALKLELAAINEWIKEKENDEFAQLLVPPEILAAQDKQHYRDLTLNEFRGLRDLVVNLETQGRRKLQYITDQEKRDLNELIDELELTAAQHNAAIEKPLSKRQQQKTSKKIGQLIGAIDAVNTKASTILAQLDGGEYGAWTRTIFEPIQAAEVQKVIRSQTEMQNLQDIIDRHYGDDYRKKRVRLKLDSAKGVVDSESYVQTFMDEDFVVRDGDFEETLTREMILTMAMHQGTADNQVKLLDGYAKTRGWTQAFINNALSNMTARDWAFVQDTWDYMDSFWPEVSKIEAKRYGYAPEKIEAQPLTVTTADGQTLSLRGGYMRIKYDRNQDVQSEKEAIAEVNKDMMIGAHAKAQTKNGSTNERVNNVERPIRLDMDVISEHVGEQVAFITMSEAVENANKILRKQRVQEAITNYIGNDARLMLETWLQDTAAGGVMAGGVINRGLRSLRGNYTVGRLGLRPMTALLQFSGLAQTAGDVGTANMTRALFKTFSRGNPYAISAEVKAKSPFMKEREFTLTRDVADAMRTLTRPDAGAVSHAAAYMLWPMQKMQEIVDTVAWTATYDKALREGFDDADAIRQADIAVARSQGSGLVSDLAAIERGTLNEQTQRQEWVKLATMFFSYFNAKYNVIKTKNIQYRNQQIGLPDLAVSYLMTFMLEGLISALIMGQLDFDRDNDEEITGSEIATAVGLLTLQQTAATIPFVRDIAGAAEGFTSQGAAQAQLQNVGSFIGTLAKTAEKMSEGDDVNWYSFMRGGVNTANAFFPIPAGMINQALRGAEKEAKDGDAQVIDYLVYRKD